MFVRSVRISSEGGRRTTRLDVLAKLVHLVEGELVPVLLGEGVDWRVGLHDGWVHVRSASSPRPLEREERTSKGRRDDDALDLGLLDRTLEQVERAVHSGVDEIGVGVGDIEVERRGSMRDSIHFLDRLVERSLLYQHLSAPPLAIEAHAQSRRPRR